MISILVSIGLGLACGVIFVWSMRGVPSAKRGIRTVAVGLPILVILTAWASWRGSFPATFGSAILIWASVGAVAWERSRRNM